MKRILQLGILFLATSALAVPVQERLVLASAATAIVRNGSSWSFSIQNNGPNAIWCGLGASTNAVLNKSLKIPASGGFWAATVAPGVKIYCIAASADQVTGAATNFMEY